MLRREHFSHSALHVMRKKIKKGNHRNSSMLVLIFHLFCWIQINLSVREGGQTAAQYLICPIPWFSEFSVDFCAAFAVAWLPTYGACSSTVCW